MRLVWVVSILVAALWTLVGQGSGPGELKSREQAARATMHVVKMTNAGGTNWFDPDKLDNVKVGDQVKWVNEGGTHTATSDDIKTGDPKKTFNTGTVKKGQEVTIVFNAAGTYKYHCEYHNGMTGTITVK